MQTNVRLPQDKLANVNKTLEDCVGCQITTNSLLPYVNGFVHGVIEYSPPDDLRIKRIIEWNGGQFDVKEVLNPHPDGSHWYDACHHPTDSYVGSFSINNNKYDVYYFEGYTYDKEVCIRYGANCEDYMSPGSLDNVKNITINFPQSTAHMTAYSMILDKCGNEK
jgi:hypothetical protein